MKIRVFPIIFLMAAGICGTAGAAETRSEQVDKLKTAATVLTRMMLMPEKSIPHSLLKNAYAIAVVPDVVKVGFVLGGRRGKGVLSVRTHQGTWSNPSFVTLTGGSIGWQIGAQATDVILVFKNRKSIDGIIRGKITLGADASVAAGPVGRHVEAGTDVRFNSEIYSYSRTRGFFAGVSLEGSALQIDDGANNAFYQSDWILADTIFFDGTVTPHPIAKEFMRTLETYSK